MKCKVAARLWSGSVWSSAPTLRLVSTPSDDNVMRGRRHLCCRTIDCIVIVDIFVSGMKGEAVCCMQRFCSSSGYMYTHFTEQHIHSKIKRRGNGLALLSGRYFTYLLQLLLFLPPIIFRWKRTDRSRLPVTEIKCSGGDCAAFSGREASA